MSKNKKPCPQFPYWGASYPDACCVDGILQDLDYCDENGNLYDKGEDVPCPFFADGIQSRREEPTET